MALKPKEHFHGSDLEKIEAVYGIKKEDIISFSANVNPLGVSFRLKETLTNHIDAITTYPDREYTSLRKCIADYVHTNYKNIVVGNGSTELISLFIQITHPMKALIVGPTYSEYEREVAMGGGRSHYFSLTEASEFELDTKALTEELSANVDLLILCNPNNPTSSVIKRQQMREILDYCKRKSITVLVDETYVEFAEEPRFRLPNTTITLSFCAVFQNSLQHRDSDLAMPFAETVICSMKSIRKRILGRLTHWLQSPEKSCLRMRIISKKQES